MIAKQEAEEFEKSTDDSKSYKAGGARDSVAGQAKVLMSRPLMCVAHDAAGSAAVSAAFTGLCWLEAWPPEIGHLKLFKDTRVGKRIPRHRNITLDVHGQKARRALLDWMLGNTPF